MREDLEKPRRSSRLSRHLGPEDDSAPTDESCRLQTTEDRSHTLRHTFGTQYMLNGGDVFSLRRIMGHSKIETTMLYAEMSDRLVAEKHRKFSPMANLEIPCY